MTRVKNTSRRDNDSFKKHGATTMLTTKVIAPNGARRDIGAKPKDTKSHMEPTATIVIPDNQRGLLHTLFPVAAAGGKSREMTLQLQRVSLELITRRTF